MNCTTPTRRPWPSMRSAEAEGGRALALAGAGVDDEQALLDGLRRDLGVLHRLALGPSWPCGARPRLRRSPVMSFHPHGQARDHEQHRGRRRAAIRWFSRPASSRNRRASAFSGTMPRPTSFETATQGPRGRASAAPSRSHSASSASRSAEHQVAQPQRQAVDQHRLSAGHLGRARRRDRAAPRAWSSRPARRARCWAMRSAISASSACAVAM